MMPARLISILGLFLFLTVSVLGQWQKVAPYNVGITGKLMAHGDVLFLYGNQGGYKLYRSSNNGDAWEDITSGITGQYSDIFSFNGRLYAAYLSTVYVSDNLGTSWTPLSSVTVTGNGALIGFAADGPTLYAFSNRKSVFKSTDNGSSWTEYLINNPNNMTMTDFCAVGNRFTAIVAGSGGWISDDGGTNWTSSNPSSGGISGVFARNNAVLGFVFTGGVSRLENGSSTWTASNDGLPAAGSFVAAVKSPVVRDNVLYGSFSIFISNQTGLVQSSTNGQSWSMVDSTGLPATNAAGSARYVAATATHLFVYYYSTQNSGGIGVHRLARPATSVEQIHGSVPDSYMLKQNYPNPFNPTTSIPFQVKEVSHVSLTVHDVVGREVAKLVNELLPAGEYRVTFDAAGLASGVYYYTMRAGTLLQTRRLVVLR